MAELLVYNKDNWMDMPSKERPDLTGKENVERKIQEQPFTLEQRIKNLAALEIKYEARDLRGDIIEVREDNAPRGKMEIDSFIFLQVSGLQNAIQYGQRDRDTRKRKYRVDLTGLQPDKDGNIKLTKNQFLNRVENKV